MSWATPSAAYVAKTFSPELKARTLKMTKEIEAAMEGEITALDWMGAETKQRALEKLHTVVNKIGYPDRWRDYSAVNVVRGDFFGNFERATEFESRRQLNKIGKPVDRGEWQIPPATVNAYYDDQMNDINFPAGVLQPPLFDPRMDDAPNYGNTGSTIGHELTHGFDDRDGSSMPMATCATGGPSRMPPHLKSTPSAWWINMRSTWWSMTSTSTAS